MPGASVRLSVCLQVGIFVTDVIRISRVALYEDGAEPPAAEIFSGSEASPLYAGASFPSRLGRSLHPNVPLPALPEQRLPEQRLPSLNIAPACLLPA